MGRKRVQEVGVGNASQGIFLTGRNVNILKSVLTKVIVERKNVPSMFKK